MSVNSVQRIWRAQGLRPHQIRTFKLSSDPDFATKVEDIVDLYVDPPASAVVLSLDEKSQIQALDRAQPSLPLVQAHNRNPKPFVWKADPNAIIAAAKTPADTAGASWPS